jgi:TolB-like protein/Flp pilus assembly protein TadD
VYELFAELKRRNVVRVAVAYVVFAWVVMQVIDVVVEPLRLPDWTATLVLVILLVGLPLVLFLSWAYEITPEGVKKTHEVDKDDSITPSTGRTLDRMIMGVMAIAIAFLVYDRMAPGGTGAETVTGPTPVASGIVAASIAVLPFADLSPGKDQDYFSDGISEELLNGLAQIPELRVAARTSSFQFKGQNLDVADIGRQLNVAHVLEGSVRRSGTQIRITAQLIDAGTGFHLWSSTYDRKLEDIFAVQDEISRAIVDALVEKLGIQTPVRSAAKQTVDTEAYEQYLLARQLMARQTPDGYTRALTFLEQAMEIAPAYADAHAAMAQVYFFLSVTNLGDIPLADSNTFAERHANRSLTFDPNQPEAIYIKGRLADRRGNSDEALAFYDKSLSINPNQSDVQQTRSVLLFDELNRFTEGIDANAAAVAIDPLDHVARRNLIISLAWAGRWQEAESHMRRIERLSPYNHAFASLSLDFTRGNDAKAVKTTILSRQLLEANSNNSLAGNLAFLGLYKEATTTTLRQEWNFYAAIENYEQAIALLEADMAENPTNENLRSSAGGLYVYMGRFAEARTLLEPLWAANNAKIVLFGIINRFSAFALMAARQETGDATGAVEVYEKMLDFQKLVDEAGVAPTPFNSAPVARAMLLAGDEAQGYRELERLVELGLYPGGFKNAALAKFADDPRMIKLMAAAEANRTRDRHVILEWLCVPEPPTDNLELHPESCAEIGR